MLLLLFITWISIVHEDTLRLSDNMLLIHDGNRWVRVTRFATDLERLAGPGDAPIELRFDRGSMRRLDSSETPTALGYREVVAKFSKNRIFVEVELRYRTTMVMLDAGFTGNIRLKPSKKWKLPANGRNVIVRDNTKEVPGAYYPRRGIGFRNITYNSSVVLAKGNQVAGIGFMKGFDWIIDSRQRKVWVRKNAMPLDAEDGSINPTL